MHQVKHSASPYFYKITVDKKLAITKSDVKIFETTVQQGVSVYGFTPNILLITTSAYSHWASISLLIAAMDTGKLAICSNDHIQDVIDTLCAEFTAINIKLFNKNSTQEAMAWLNA